MKKNHTAIKTMKGSQLESRIDQKGEPSGARAVIATPWFSSRSTILAPSGMVTSKRVPSLVRPCTVLSMMVTS